MSIFILLFNFLAILMFGMRSREVHYKEYKFKLVFKYLSFISLVIAFVLSFFTQSMLVGLSIFVITFFISIILVSVAFSIYFKKRI